jgi:hypothetical protein
MSRKLHREISRRWFRIGAYDEQMVKNRASRSARTAAVVAASIASMPAIREMALLMPEKTFLRNHADGIASIGRSIGAAFPAPTRCSKP